MDFLHLCASLGTAATVVVLVLLSPEEVEEVVLNDDAATRLGLRMLSADSIVA